MQIDKNYRLVGLSLIWQSHVELVSINENGYKLDLNFFYLFVIKFINMCMFLKDVVSLHKLTLN